MYWLENLIVSGHLFGTQIMHGLKYSFRIASAALLICGLGFKVILVTGCK